jgi:hypothetical protein
MTRFWSGTGAARKEISPKHGVSDENPPIPEAFPPA